MKALLPVFFCILALGLRAQSIFFEKIYGNGGNEQLRSVKEFPNGSVFAAGFSDSGVYGGVDVALSRLDQYGNLQWTKYYGDNLNNYCLFMSRTADGCLVLCGETQTSSSLLDAFLFKIDTTGNLLWAQYYSSPVNESMKSVFETSDGGFILCGFKNDAFGSNDSYVIRTDAAGNMQWDFSFGGMDNEYADMARETPEGDFIITGDTKSFGAGGYDVQIVKCDAAGAVIWDTTYGDSYQNGCQGIYITAGNKYISYGETEISTFSPFDFYIEMIDTGKAGIWRQVFGGVNADAAFGLTELPDKGFMLCGYSNSYGPGPLDLVVFRTDSMGAMQWIRTYGSGGIDIGYEIIPSVLGGFLVCGFYSDTLSFDSEFYLLHVDDAGLLTGLEADPPGMKAFTVYPNPSAGAFALSFPALARQGSMRIFSSDGRILMVQPVAAGSTRLGIEAEIPGGIYFIELACGPERSVQKLIIH
ncbi:MAG: T9SS type A sorting domain-containing protein [Bacteroidota bacterium]